jgi:uncharacterized membrane protein YqjE
MEMPGDSPPGPFASMQRLWRVILATAHNRLELLLVEVEEERQRAFEVLILTMAMAVLGLMTLIVGSFALIIIFWEDHRLAVLVILGLSYLLATLGMWWRLRLRRRNWQSFSATVAELKKDKAWLEEKK